MVRGAVGPSRRVMLQKHNKTVLIPAETKPYLNCRKIYDKPHIAGHGSTFSGKFYRHMKSRFYIGLI